MKDTNLSGYGFSGVYQLERAKQNKEEDLFDVMYEKYYSHWTDSEMQNAIAERKTYRDQYSF